MQVEDDLAVRAPRVDQAVARREIVLDLHRLERRQFEHTSLGRESRVGPVGIQRRRAGQAEQP